MKLNLQEKGKNEKRVKWIVCEVCGGRGGTLIKTGTGYRHGDSEWCEIVKLRKRGKGKLDKH